ncbi:NAD(P)-binding domain-containing protein [Vibrio lentus]|nr:NAD(P)-binding domain-containing protein [Vibrio lentus]
MASNIFKGDHEVKVFDLNADAVNGLVELGATAAESAPDAAKDVDFIITMLYRMAVVGASCIVW